MVWKNLVDNLKLIVKNLWNFTKFIFNFTVICCEKFCKLFLNFVKFLFEFVVKHLLIIIQIICLCLLVYNGFDLTSDYLLFDYVFKLEVLDTQTGYDFPGISVCTENNVLFDKNKVLGYFDLSEEYSQMKNNLWIKYTEDFNTFKDRILNKGIQQKKYHFLITEMNYKLSKLLIPYEKMIFVELYFYEMISLRVKAEELFDCSAKLHIRNQSIFSKVTEIDSCIGIREKLYFNEEYGICYTLFTKTMSTSFMMNDYIEIRIKSSTLRHFMINGINFQDIYYKDIKYFELYWQDNFLLYFMMNNLNFIQPVNKMNAFKTEDIGSKNILQLKRQGITFLSKPYMDQCNDEGKFV